MRWRKCFHPDLTELNASRGGAAKKRHRFRSGHGVFEECTGKRDHPFNLTEALAAYVLEGLLQSGDISLDEGKMVLDVIMSNEAENKGRLLVLRKLGVATCLIAEGSVVLEKGVKVAADINLAASSEELKTKFM